MSAKVADSGVAGQVESTVLADRPYSPESIRHVQTRLARHWLSGIVVQHLPDESSPVGLPAGLRSFQRGLDYRLVRVRIGDRTPSQRPSAGKKRDR